MGTCRYCGGNPKENCTAHGNGACEYPEYKKPKQRKRRGEAMNIEINMDSVVIEGQAVKRPEYFGRKQWLDYWESLLAVKKQYCKHCGMTTKI